MDRIQDEQRRRNRMARGCWDLYAAHRQRVTELLLGRRLTDTSATRGLTPPGLAGRMSTLGDEPPAPRLCVLGAGNCNDLDLPQLLTAFSEVYLVDLDGEALFAGVAAQNLTADARLRLHAGIDVTGLNNRLSDWTCAQPPSAADADVLLAAAAADADLPLGGPFDIVASVCLLSQLLEAVQLALGETHSHYLPLVQAVRGRHLRQAVQLCRPGGRLVIVTDFVSSDTCRDLVTVAEAQLPALAEQLVIAQNFFTGLNPFLLRRLFLSDPWLAARVAQPQLSKPWRWHFPTRVYAVCALTANRR
jgi:SAM-dependent methyltransferase